MEKSLKLKAVESEIRQSEIRYALLFTGFGFMLGLIASVSTIVITSPNNQQQTPIQTNQ